MNEDEQISQDDFLKAFGVAPTTTESANENDSTNATTDDQDSANPGTDAQESTANTNADSASENGDNKGNQTEANNGATNETSKSAQAFAAMRVELAAKNKMLDNVASILGIDMKAKDSADQLQAKITEALAKQKGISPEILQRLNELEEKETQRNSEQIRSNALMGFQKVKTKYGLDDTQLQEFANQLVADGKNPFVTNLDLETEYKLKNFDKLLEQAKTKGAQEEIARAAKAEANASTPGNNQGVQSNNDVQQITTVKQLNEWFNQQQKSV